MSALLETLDQLARPIHRLDLVDQLEVALGLAVADLVSVLLLGPVVGQGGDQLIAAHPDVTVDSPHRQHDAVLAKRAVPGDRMVIVGVDERPVDVEHGNGHGLPSYPLQSTEIARQCTVFLGESYREFSQNMSKMNATVYATTQWVFSALTRGPHRSSLSSGVTTARSLLPPPWRWLPEPPPGLFNARAPAPGAQ